MSRPSRRAANASARGTVRRDWRRRVRYLVLSFSVLGLGAAIFYWWSRPQPMPPTEIFRGVVYSCERLQETAETGGLMHLVQIDLTTPGLELYVTPVDPEAASHGWEYRLRWPPSVAAAEQLSILVSATLSESNFEWWEVPGGWSRSLETVVSSHQVNHIDPNSYLLWFEDDLTPHLEKTKPPPVQALKRARWGLAGQGISISEGEISPYAGHDVDARVMIGIHAEKKLLFLATFERASIAAAAAALCALGATDTIALDGGTSACMIIGKGATGIRPGTLMYPGRGRPVVFGVRAPPLQRSD